MKQRGVWKSAIIIVVVAAQILILPLAGLAQNNGFVINPIVKRGDPVSDGGRFFDCKDCEGRVIGLHALNNRGDVAIGADVVSGRCFVNRFLISGGQSIRLADFCHTAEWDFTFLGPVNINDGGQAVINTGVTVNNRIVEMLLLYSEGRLTKLVEEGDQTPLGTTFLGCGFGQPAINNGGEVAFFACAETRGGVMGRDGVFKYSNGEIKKVVISTDPSPIGGEFALNFIPPQAVHMNNHGEVLFEAGVIIEPSIPEKYGLFLAARDGIKKIEVDGDQMPTGGIVTPRTFGFGDLNDESDVVFAVGLTGGPSDSGIFLHSGGQISKIMAQGEPTPAGGRFATLIDIDFFTPPRINNNGAVAFLNKVTGGSTPAAIFLASPRATVKVAAIGDALPTGGKIKEITSFALNDFGQVAFYAEVKNGPKGVFLASPLPPAISKAKLKNKNGRLELRVDGNALITNDTVIEINGVALSDLDYPDGFRESGGTTRRVVSRDSRLEQLLPAGQAVPVTVYNPLTNLRSAAVAFTR